MPGVLLADDGSGFTFKPVDGTEVVWRPYIETEGGYDSNLDNLVNGPGSAFEKTETGGSLKINRPGETYYFTALGRQAVFMDLEDSNRWEVKLSGDATFDLSATDTLNLTTAYHRDFFSLDHADIYTSDIEYAKKEADYRFRLQARSTTEANIGGNQQGGQARDVFNVTRGKAYDYSKTEGYTTLLGFTRSVVQPFAIYDIANLDYFSQVANPLIDRNAVEQYGIAGLRFQFSADLRVDVGGRINYRDFEDKTTTDFTSSFGDVNVFWQPLENVKITMVMERVIKEPSTSFGLADDVRTGGVTLDWNITRDWLLSGAGYYDRVEAIGDDLRYNKYLATLSLTYYPNEHLELFASTLAKWVDEEVTGESYDRYKAGLGARIKF